MRSTGPLAAAADAVRRRGRHGDTRLVHVNEGELAALDRLWGPHTVNPDTGLPEYFDLLGTIGDVVGGISSGLGSLLGGSGGGDAISGIGSLLGSLFGGGPTMGAPQQQGSAAMYGAPLSMDGPYGASGAGGAARRGGSGSSWLDLLRLAAGAASAIGGFTQNSAYSRQQRKLQQQQRQQQKEQSQHVDYGIGGPGNVTYGQAAPFPTELAGFNPVAPLTTRTPPTYAVGGSVGVGPLRTGPLRNPLPGNPSAWAPERPAAPGDAGDPGGMMRAVIGHQPWWSPRGAGMPDGSGMRAALDGPGLRDMAGMRRGMLGLPGMGRLAGMGGGPPTPAARGGRMTAAGAALPAGALSHPQGQVPGEGTGQSDEVPAYLSKDEYVVPADVVSHLGDGSSGAGARKMDKLVSHVRKKRTGSSRFPPRTGGLNQMKQMMGSR